MSVAGTFQKPGWKQPEDQKRVSLPNHILLRLLGRSALVPHRTGAHPGCWVPGAGSGRLGVKHLLQIVLPPPGRPVCEAPRGHTVPTSSRPTRALPWANEKAGVIITTSTRRPCPSVQGNYLAAVVGVAHGEPPSRAPGGGLHLHTSPGAPAALHSPLHRRYQVA
ncbi:uncharacterized protein LOC111094485 isoform X1 [Canis lupus familiaris]|uniref:uncharacterized protein LOC111094485 isoform X1 n=1 Tax=Canis lupus familiaris TaxID=9615 RepID=UPI0018F5DE32|nr:uncharacterized protein LOC111094485 isoform X1 [Canis lupus familiaris]